MSVMEEERSIEILKRRIEDQKKEITRLTILSQTWKEKALKYEDDWKEQNNKIRSHKIRPVSSVIDPSIPSQATALRMMKDLEGELSEAKRLLQYEKELRDNRIGHLKEEVDQISDENAILS